MKYSWLSIYWHRLLLHSLLHKYRHQKSSNPFRHVKKYKLGLRKGSPRLRKLAQSFGLFRVELKNLIWFKNVSKKILVKNLLIKKNLTKKMLVLRNFAPTNDSPQNMFKNVGQENNLVKHNLWKRLWLKKNLIKKICPQAIGRKKLVKKYSSKNIKSKNNLLQWMLKKIVPKKI